MVYWGRFGFRESRPSQSARTLCERVFQSIGIAYIGSGALVAVAGIGFGILSPERYHLWGNLGTTVVATAGAIFCLWGWLTCAYRSREGIVNANLVIVSALMVTPIVGELFFRVAIATAVER